MCGKRGLKESLKARAIGYRALNVIRRAKLVKVIGVFDKSIYLGFGRRYLVSMVGNMDYMTPYSILLEVDKSFKSLGVRSDTSVELKSSALVFDAGTLTVGLEKASIWTPPSYSLSRKSIKGVSQIGLNLRILRDAIYTCPSREGLVPLLEEVEKKGPLKLFLEDKDATEPTLSQRARPAVEALMWGLFGGSTSVVLDRASVLIGLGPGLTPSCDDFLAGLMLSLLIGGKAIFGRKSTELSFYGKVATLVSRLARGKTNVYGESLLIQAKSGEGPKVVIDLIHSILTGKPSEVASLSRSVLNIGETSGADIATGIFYGIRFLLSKLEHLEVQRIDEFYRET
ncbi:hypothetical protein HRbin37_01938 [bacterium HR37]|nr:hypothetical protein HRbin37_01938 [bacterium HR37]